jgi:hypothetical protein
MKAGMNGGLSRLGGIPNRLAQEKAKKECSCMDNETIAHEWFRYAVQDLIQHQLIICRVCSRFLLRLFVTIVNRVLKNI